MDDKELYLSKKNIEDVEENIIYKNGNSKKVILTVGLCYSVFIISEDENGEIIECGHVKSGQYS